MKNNRIILSIPRLEKETIQENSFLTPDVFDIENNEFLTMTHNLNYQFIAELHSSGVVVKGTAETIVSSICSRCLTPTDQVINCSYTLFMDDLNSGDIDITDDIREELMLKIPMNFICNENCKGLCHNCGANLNTQKCKCNENDNEAPTVWDALNDLKL